MGTKPSESVTCCRDSMSVWQSVRPWHYFSAKMFCFKITHSDTCLSVIDICLLFHLSSGHWDGLVISSASFPLNYWDKFVKKKVQISFTCAHITWRDRIYMPFREAWSCPIAHTIITATSLTGHQFKCIVSRFAWTARAILQFSTIFVSMADGLECGITCYV